MESVGLIMSIKKITVITCIIATIAFSFTACNSSDNYRKTLQSGYEKYLNGENMSRDEYNAVKSFNNWKAKQGEKSYNEWNN